MTVMPKTFISTPKKVDKIKLENQKYDHDDFLTSPATIKKNGRGISMARDVFEDSAKKVDYKTARNGIIN